MCKHKKYNNKCEDCREIISYCGYAYKEGYKDFEVDYSANVKCPIDYRQARAYYLWALSCGA